MATYKSRGSSHSVIFPYYNQNREYRQQWETYTMELEAIQRKAKIDFLQKNKRYDELYQEVLFYREKRTAERAEKNKRFGNQESITPTDMNKQENLKKSYGEFLEKWLPTHARKRRFSPNSYDSYSSQLKNHVLPYFGERIMSTITSQEIDEYVDMLSKKPCRGSKSYNKNPEEIPRLSSSSAKNAT